MSNFQYNWQFTYKVNELIPAFERKIASLNDELAEFDRKHADPEQDERDNVSAEDVERYIVGLPRGVQQVVRLAMAEPKPTVVRRARPVNSLVRSQLRMCERILKALHREDEHRQYRLTHQDLEFLDL